VRHVECSAIGLADLTDWTQFNWTCAAIKADLERDAGAAAAIGKGCIVISRKSDPWPTGGVRRGLWLPTRKSRSGDSVEHR
jgi:hypothetical protein